MEERGSILAIRPSPLSTKVGCPYLETSGESRSLTPLGSKAVSVVAFCLLVRLSSLEGDGSGGVELKQISVNFLCASSHKPCKTVFTMSGLTVTSGEDIFIQGLGEKNFVGPFLIFLIERKMKSWKLKWSLVLTNCLAGSGFSLGRTAILAPKQDEVVNNAQY